MPEIPEMVIPSSGSTYVFVAIIVYIAIAFVVGVWRGGPVEQPSATRKRWVSIAIGGMLIWLAVTAIVPFSKVLEIQMLPPPAMIFVAFCFVTAFVLAFSSAGARLAQLPLFALVGFHAFRLPLEMVLHHWYEGGTMPVQMTWSGHNFDVVTGVVAILVGFWALTGKVPRAVIWGFGILGSVLLLIVIGIALTSTPIPIRQYMNDPPVLLAFYFPYSWIVSVAVTGALLWHIVLFRRLMSAASD